LVWFVDVITFFLPAARELLAGRSPYSVHGFYNPPWALLPFIPLTWLPERWALWLYLIMSVGVLLFVAWRLSGDWRIGALFLLAPPTLYSLGSGTLEWLVLLGLILPPRWGILLLVIKPQVGIGAIVYHVVEAWRGKRWRGVIDLLIPLAVLLAASFALYGLWPLQGDVDWAVSGRWNAALGPWAVAAGVWILYRGLQDRHVGTATAASPFFANYVGAHSWTVSWMLLLGSLRWSLVAFLCSWGWLAIRAL